MTQWSPNQIAGIDALVGLTGHACAGFQKLVELNLKAMQFSLSETRGTPENPPSGENPQGFQWESIQPAADRALAYNRQILELLAATRREFEKVMEVQYTTGKQGWQDFMEIVVDKAEAVQAAPLAAWQDSVNATTTFYESVQRTAKAGGTNS